MTGTVTRMWGGRFTSGPAPDLDRLNRSLPVDRRLWREDIRGSQAWVRALSAAGVLTEGERQALTEGLDAVRARLARWSERDWEVAADEDIHSLVERLLHEEAGAVAGKLHTGRSRNDQVATDTRLWGMAAAERLDVAVRDLQLALADQAEAHLETLMPGYTHLQPAQPITAAHWLLSHAWAMERDRERLSGAARRTAVLPLGSGAVAGCPFPIDRRALAADLGFERVSENSLDAVADRDWAAELVFAAGLLGVHLSRLAEDVIVYASAPFSLLRLSDAYSTGSSLMPQKRNPDAMELARGKAGVLLGDLVALLATLKATPSGYNKDLQEDKAILFHVFDTLEAVLPAVAGTMATLTIRTDACAAVIPEALMATDLAELLVDRGVPFRVAHERVGRVLAQAEEEDRPLGDVAFEAWHSDVPGLTRAAVDEALDPRAAVGRRDSEGGTAPARVREQLAAIRARVDAPA